MLFNLCLLNKPLINNIKKAIKTCARGKCKVLLKTTNLQSLGDLSHRVAKTHNNTCTIDLNLFISYLRPLFYASVNSSTKSHSTIIIIIYFSTDAFKNTQVLLGVYPYYPKTVFMLPCEE